MLLGSALLVAGASSSFANGAHGGMAGHNGQRINRFPARTNPLLIPFPFGHRFNRFAFTRFGFNRFGGLNGFGFPFGASFAGAFDGFGVADAVPGPLGANPAPFPGAFGGPFAPPRVVVNDRPSVEATPQGVQIVRGPGSHHLLR